MILFFFFIFLIIFDIFILINKRLIIYFKIWRFFFFSYLFIFIFVFRFMDFYGFNNRFKFFDKIIFLGFFCFISSLFILLKNYKNNGFFWNISFFLSLQINLLELISLLIRPISLTLRLFLNLLIGHILIRLIIIIGKFSFFFFILELFIIIIQCLIFSFLVILYFREFQFILIKNICSKIKRFNLKDKII